MAASADFWAFKSDNALHNCRKGFCKNHLVKILKTYRFVRGHWTKQQDLIVLCPRLPLICFVLSWCDCQDIYLAGPPCQPYSRLNNKKRQRNFNPFMTDEGKVFVETARQIRHLSCMGMGAWAMMLTPFIGTVQYGLSFKIVQGPWTGIGITGFCFPIKRCHSWPRPSITIFLFKQFSFRWSEATSCLAWRGASHRLAWVFGARVRVVRKGDRRLYILYYSITYKL